jgi:hypothetical protein
MEPRGWNRAATGRKSPRPESRGIKPKSSAMVVTGCRRQRIVRRGVSGPVGRRLCTIAADRGFSFPVKFCKLADVRQAWLPGLHRGVRLFANRKTKTTSLA